MAPIIYLIVNMINNPLGNLVYSVVLGLSAISALIAAWYAHGNQEYPEAKRMQLGLSILLVVQVLLFILSWLVWLGVMDGHIFMPPLDRAMALFSLLMVIWLWVFPKVKPIVDWIFIATGITILLAGVISLVWWLSQNSNTFFNTSLIGGYAYYSGLALLLVGLILLLWRRPNSWGYGILMLLIMLVGYLAQYLFPQGEGDFSWLVHLGEMVAFPLLLALPRRLLPYSRATEIPDGAKSGTPSITHVDAKLIQSVIKLGNETSLTKYLQKVTQLVAQLLDADVCLFLMPPKTGEQIVMPVGYNQLDNHVMEGFTADGYKMPLLLDAVRSGKTLCLDGSKPGTEIVTLSNEIGLKHIPHLLETPFLQKGLSSEMGILVLSKPSQPLWSDKDVLRFTEVISALASGTSRSSGASIPSPVLGENLIALQRSKADYEKLRQAYAQLYTDYTKLNEQVAQGTSQLGVFTPTSENQKSLQDNLEQLETRNRELESLVARGKPSIEEVEQLRQELRGALVDLARIPSTLSKSDQKMLEIQLSTMKHLDDMGPVEMVTSIAQEFRQPLSSIVGYTELMLGESVGLLGAMQRKFLERIKASTERMGILLNELVQAMAINGGEVNQAQTIVDLNQVITEAVGNIQGQISEKNIRMQVDLPENIPAINANKDAIQQVVANLLQNACLVTPENGEITLIAAGEQKENALDFIQISVADQGGGIDKADLPRVFSRRYKMENPAIKGIGDTGVGLSIVKTLVELHKGRIWVDSQEGIGSTFIVLLPSQTAVWLINPSLYL
jgi:signal transduction histidine kinase